MSTPSPSRQRQRPPTRPPPQTFTPLPPLRPPPPVSSKAKDYTDRPMETLDELDELRKRGTAKLLNRHFNATIQQVAKEQADNDKALQDLEQRRAAQKKLHNHPTASPTLNPYDSLYIQLKETQKQCRRKEQETLLLYQRYVAKFGATGLVAAPKVKQKKKVMYAGSRAMYTEKIVEVDEEEHQSKDAERSSGDEMEITEDTLKNKQDLDFQKYYKKLFAKQKKEKEAAKQNKQKNAASVVKEEAVVPKEDPKKEETAVTPLPIQQPEQSKPLDSPESPIEKASSISVVASDAVDAVEDVIVTKAITQVTETIEQVASVPVVTPLKVKAPEQQQPTKEEEAKEKSAEESITVTDTAASNDVIMETPHKNTNPVQDVDSEPETSVLLSNSSKIDGVAPEYTPEEDTPIKSNLSEDVKIEHNNSHEVPSATTTEDEDDEDDNDLSSIISGLTSVHSGVTKQQLMEDLEGQLACFLQTETANIRKMMDTEKSVDEHTTEEQQSVASGSLLGDESRRATAQAETMARQMQEMLDKFGQGGNEKSEGEVLVTKAGYPRKYHTDNPNENWMVHWDDQHRREYYFETRTKRSVWETPAAITFKSTATDSDQASVVASVHTANDDDDQSLVSRRTMFSHVDVSPSDDISLKSSSRRQSYRKLVRKQRKRRRRIVASMLLLMVLSIIVWRSQSPKLSNMEWLAAQKATLQDKYEYTFTDRLEREEREEQMKHHLTTRQEEERRRAEKARIAELQAQEKAQQEHLAKIAAELKIKEEAAARERERKKQENFQALLRTIAERKVEIEETKDAWNCRFPFSKRFNPRCGGSATIKELTNSGAIGADSSFGQASTTETNILDPTQMVQYLME